MISMSINNQTGVMPLLKDNTNSLSKTRKITKGKKLQATILTIGTIVSLILGAVALGVAFAVAAIPLAVTVLTITGITLIGAGAITSIFVKCHKPTWKGFKYMIGMIANRIAMKEKNLENCNLFDQQGNKHNEQIETFVDNVNLQGQWANPVFKLKDNNNIVVLGAQLQEEHINQLENTQNEKNITVLAVLEQWEEKGAHFGMKPAIPGNDQQEQKKTNVIDNKKTRQFSDNITQHLIQTPDHQGIDIKNLRLLADEINNGLNNGHVYVHCKSGKGRSAQAIVAYLIKHKKLNPVEATEIVTNARRFANIQTNKLQNLFENFENDSRNQELI